MIPCFYREDGAGGRGALPDLPGGAPRQDGDLDGDDTVLHHLQLSRGGVRDVEDATVVQGFGGDPVVDPKLYFAVVVQVANADARIERQIVVGRGELSNGSPLAVGFPSNASPYQLARPRRT